ncbi:hypothetical protein [Ruegeria arenilitoris]|uniref:Uncharacterized protein n=1 Tax=Ruegeria arenilitoris TaxID=1173585 RepID=A0A238K0Q2_9RHOB|nr:hypothetical protein [Ruegeria arenilitoris]SMX36491.1 hypothetical protein RUA8715_01417 [Ruegeria arenilitoris]
MSRISTLPRTTNKHGRVRSDDALVYEASSIVRSVILRYKRYSAAGGFHADFRWFKDHLDDDDALTQRVLTSAGFAPDERGSWVWRRGVWPLAKVTDMDALGDALVTLVDVHRPV